MKNVIFVISDALCEYFMDLKLGGKFVCHNLHELKENNIYFSNVFSQAPYTMGALNSLFTGNDTFDRGTYEAFLGGNRDLIFDAFSDLGYEEYCFLYGFFAFPHNTVCKMKKRWVFAADDFVSYSWPSVRYLIRQIKNNSDNLINVDRSILSRLVENILSAARIFLKDDNCGETFICGTHNEFPWDEFLYDLKNDLISYSDDSEAFLDELLIRDGDMGIFSQKYLRDYKGYINSENEKELKQFYKKNKGKFAYIFFKQLQLNFLSLSIPYKDIMKYLLHRMFGSGELYPSEKNQTIQLSQRIRGYNFTYNSFMSNNASNMYGDYSAKKKFDILIDELKNRPNRNVPFFSYIHLLDTHQPYNFISAEYPMEYDTEMDAAFDVIKRTKHGEWHGSLAYLMSAIYIDKCIGRLIDKLIAEGLDENTVLVFTSDHGLQYGNSPIRNKNQGDNVNFESYHVPLIIADFSQKRNYHISKMCSSKDVFPTIFDIVGIKAEKYVKGINMFDDSENNMYVNIEYLGSGQPDIYRKKIVYGLRSETRSLVCKVFLDEDVTYQCVDSVYDLTWDLDEKKNVKKYMNDDLDVNQMLKVIAARHKEIQNKYSIVEHI